MASPGFALIVATPALVIKMLTRARTDLLPPSHEMVVRARALEQAYVARFIVRPPDIAACQWVDYYIRAYAAWHAYTGED